MSIGGHQNPVMKKDEWLTPPFVLESLGVFDLDPCSPVERPWDTALKHFSIKDNGLEKEWFGRVWCNPPYGLEAAKWLHKLAIHGSGIALIFARTETKMFFNEVWPKASAILFLEGRLSFYHVCGTKAKSNSGAPSVLVSYGKKDADVLKNCGLAGKLIYI